MIMGPVMFPHIQCYVFTALRGAVNTQVQVFLLAERRTNLGSVFGVVSTVDFPVFF